MQDATTDPPGENVATYRPPRRPGRLRAAAREQSASHPPRGRTDSMVGEALGGPMRVLVWRDGDVRAITVEPAELEAA